MAADEYNAMDAVEAAELMRNIAALTRTFHGELLAQGFDKNEALTLTQTWLSASVSGGHGR